MASTSKQTGKKTGPKILLADDLGMDRDREKRSYAARLCAGRIARRLSGSVDVAHIEDIYLYPVKNPKYEPLIEQYFSQQRKDLERLTSQMEAPARMLFLNGDPVKKLVSMTAKAGAYEMLVLGTHGRSGISRLMLGSVAEEVIRNARVPVMTVGPGAQGSQNLLSQEKLTILVPTALTANSHRAEDYAAKLAKKTGGRVVLFHSMHDSLHPVLQTAFSAPHAPPAIGEMHAQMKTQAQKGLAKIADRLKRLKIDTTVELDTGTNSSADAVLAAIAKHSAGLVIMGTHGRSLLSSAFFGRTARDVILGAPVPVVTVRSSQK